MPQQPAHMGGGAVGRRDTLWRACAGGIVKWNRTREQFYGLCAWWEGPVSPRDQDDVRPALRVLVLPKHLPEVCVISTLQMEDGLERCACTSEQHKGAGDAWARIRVRVRTPKHAL